MSQWAPAGVVTPEAVPLDFEPAGVGTRSVAFLLDASLQLVLFWTLAIAGSAAAAGAGPGLPDWVAVVLVLLLTFGVLWGYPIAFETLWRGRTLGKAALGLRVVTVEGGPERFRHAVVRAVLGLVDFGLLFGAVALVSALVTRRSQRLGDLAAGTIVVRERTGTAPPAVARFAVPQGAESYAATIDPSGVTPADYHALRQLLLRAPQLDPAVRADLARNLAAPLARRIGHTPPPGVAPELFLACLAARYQQRAAPVAPTPAGAVPVAPPPATSAGDFAPPG